jgi:serine protease Do
MARRFLVVTMSLVATIGFLVGLVVAGSMAPSRAQSAPRGTAPDAVRPVGARPARLSQAAGSFADVAEQLNPAVVNIDATVRDAERSQRLPEEPSPSDPRRSPEGPRRGAGTGFIIDPAGFILTNHHVIDGADRITVRLADGRSLRAERIGSDPDTDIALIRVRSPGPLPHAILGDSDTLRVGEWVLAIGNPLAYEHTVTVGVVSFIGRKLFDSSLDRYIQTDAAINYGNSGGPLINSRGEVIGINAAISSRASSIGFAVPINQATAILSQLRASGRVSRGYIGVALRAVDADLQQSLGLSAGSGVLVQDVTPGSPGDRAGMRVYDLIVAIDGHPVTADDELIQLVSARTPGATATVQVVRDGRPLSLAVKLAERPLRETAVSVTPPGSPDSHQRSAGLGLDVREIDASLASRLSLPRAVAGVLVARVDPGSPAFEADIERGHVVLEVNRHPVRSVDDFRRLTDGATSGDVLALYLFRPDTARRELRTVTVE